MRKISVDHKRNLDSAVTGQLLKITSIRNELESYTTAFIKAFNADNVPLFPAPAKQVTLAKLTSLSVKGGLGIENLEAQATNQPPNRLVWNNYAGDADFNLLIEKEAYPPGLTTGAVMASVGQRIKMLLAETIGTTRFANLTQILSNQTLQAPLYLCNQVEALAHLVDFLSQDLTPPIDGANFPVNADALTIAKCLSGLEPALSGIRGPDIQRAFQAITASSGNQLLVYRDREEKLFFVSDVGRVKSEWFDVDYSFFPYAPGRMDGLGFEVTELAIAQQRAREVNRTKLPYDIFKVVTSDFTYTESERTMKELGPFDDFLYTAEFETREQKRPKSPYNLSLYANNLIDDFDLIRTALRFPGISVSQPKDIAKDDYRADVGHGAAKCEFVDVAIPRIASPEWFYLQDRVYYDKIPANPQPNQAYVKVCNWEYQCEENLNLLIELAAGQSHSAHKSGKRIDRLITAWNHCNMATVFPRSGGNAKLPNDVSFEAPALLVSNFADDYERLYGFHPLPDEFYVQVFEPLFLFHQALAACQIKPNDTTRKAVVTAAGVLGQTGLSKMACGAQNAEAPIVSGLRTLVDAEQLSCDWALAALLTLKASRIGDRIWFPISMKAEVKDANAVNNANLGLPQANDCDIIFATRTGGLPSQWLTLTLIPQGVDGTTPIDFTGPLVRANQRLINKVRENLLHSNNQMLRIAYGQILNVLLRANADSYLDNIIPLDG
ncbi:hypothetical protein [Nisaea sediminum]|uniref:hypothetical protein n=1 Tax=Nisaea sediminum TaxID=2775867 RepID=UPI0018686E0A|nr:hypothetical protein [Nisaea sediminum]